MQFAGLSVIAVQVPVPKGRWLEMKHASNCGTDGVLAFSTAFRFPTGDLKSTSHGAYEKPPNRVINRGTLGLLDKPTTVPVVSKRSLKFTIRAMVLPDACYVGLHGALSGARSLVKTLLV